MIAWPLLDLAHGVFALSRSRRWPDPSSVSHSLGTIVLRAPNRSRLESDRRKNGRL